MDQNANAASVALLSRTHVLLIQRALPPLAGYWTLPGGRREPGESTMDCARREISEELGLVVGELTPVTKQTHGAFAIAVFAAAMPEGVPRPSDEIADWRWCAPEDFAELRTTDALDKIVKAARALTPV